MHPLLFCIMLYLASCKTQQKFIVLFVSCFTRMTDSINSDVINALIAKAAEGKAQDPKVVKSTRYGMCDNRRVFSDMLSPSRQAMIFRNLDLGPFTPNNTGTCDVDTQGYMSVCSYYMTLLPSFPDACFAIIKESLAPFQDPDQWMGKEDSQARFVKGMITIARDHFGTALAAVSANLPALYASGDAGKALCKKFTGKDDPPETRTYRLRDDAALDEHESWMLMDFIVSQAPEDMRRRMVVPIMLMILCVTKTGTVTDQWCNKLVTSCAELGPVLRTCLTRDVIRNAWAVIGSSINDKNIEGLLSRWYEAIPGEMIRVSVAIRQATDKDMTSLNTIKEFVTANPKFPYHLLMRLYPIEMTAVLGALIAVGDRKFYGYRKDPGVAKSTNYRNTTWG